jgi:hypothetical protein
MDMYPAFSLTSDTAVVMLSDGRNNGVDKGLVEPQPGLIFVSTRIDDRLKNTDLDIYDSGRSPQFRPYYADERRIG